MRTLEIPREAWRPALDTFTAIHAGWLVSLEILDPAIGAQPEIENLPLLGVSVEHPEGEGDITISAGRPDTPNITHTIHAPSRVDIERRDDGAVVALQIEAADGTKAILRFLTAALPETVDGLTRLPAPSKPAARTE